MTGPRQATPRFLVTGATGFIGRRLVPRLIAEFGPSSVTCLVKTPASEAESSALARYESDGIAVLRGDLLQSPVGPTPAPFDVVFHLAANIDTDADEEALRVNHVGTGHLLEWLGPASRPLRIVYASSIAVHDRDRRPTGPISETSPFVPRTLYGRTKLEGERILQAGSARLGYTWTILRLPTVYGHGQKADGLFDKFRRLAETGEAMARIDWPGRTSVIHVDDVAAVMVEFALRDDTAGEIYCVAADEAPTVGELARRIAAAIGRPIRAVSIPGPVVAALQAIVWNRLLAALVPRFARLSFWRLSLVISDGFWFDTAKFRGARTKAPRNLDEGLVDTLISGSASTS